MRMRRLFYVYAVELRPLPGRGPSVYVGSSALPPPKRLHHHTDPEAGRRMFSSRHVRRRGVRLLPHLYEGLNPYPSRADAKRAEQELRTRLEKRGYVVYGSCRPGPECAI